MTGFSNTRRLTIEWGHCDPAGIVFNPRFFEFFDWSTALLLEAALGLPKPAMIATYELIGIPLVETTAKFMRPARFGEAVEIVSVIDEVKRSSFAVLHRLSVGGGLAVEGRETRVWAGHGPDGGLKAKAIPDEVRAKLEGVG